MVALEGWRLQQGSGKGFRVCVGKRVFRTRVYVLGRWKGGQRIDPEIKMACGRCYLDTEKTKSIRNDDGDGKNENKNN